jgi:hypothetical protein
LLFFNILRILYKCIIRNAYPISQRRSANDGNGTSIPRPNW